MLAYLEVVGLRPEDCYSAQCTVDHHRELVQGGMFTTNIGPRQPCADGKPRMRSHGCEHVVVAYRDRPEYAEGRERWSAYQGEVLLAGLHKGVRGRRPLAVGPGIEEVPTGLRTMVRFADSVDRMLTWGQETVPAFRYCWPPVG